MLDLAPVLIHVCVLVLAIRCCGQFGSPGAYPGDDCVTSNANTFPILNLREGTYAASVTHSAAMPASVLASPCPPCTRRATF